MNFKPYNEQETGVECAHDLDRKVSVGVNMRVNVCVFY